MHQHIRDFFDDTFRREEGGISSSSHASAAGLLMWHLINEASRGLGRARITINLHRLRLRSIRAATCLTVALDVVSYVGEERRLGLCRALLHPPRHPSQPLLRYHCTHHSLRTPPPSSAEMLTGMSQLLHTCTLQSRDYMHSGCVEGSSLSMEYARAVRKGCATLTAKFCE